MSTEGKPKMSFEKIQQDVAAFRILNDGLQG